MTKDAKKYKITIFGDSFTIVTDESEEHIMHAALRVETQMKELAERLGATDVKRLAMLASFQIVSKLLHLELYLEQENQLASKLHAEIDKALEL